MYYAGIIYPNNSHIPIENRIDTSNLYSTLRGCNVTYNHVGIQDACGHWTSIPSDMHAVIEKNMKKNALIDPSHFPIGKVIDATRSKDGSIFIMFCIDEKTFPKITQSILRGHLTGLSMSNVPGHCLEVSILPSNEPPGFDGCAITFATNSEKYMSEYKRNITSMEYFTSYPRFTFLTSR